MTPNKSAGAATWRRTAAAGLGGASPELVPKGRAPERSTLAIVVSANGSWAVAVGGEVTVAVAGAGPPEGWRDKAPFHGRGGRKSGAKVPPVT